MNDELPKSIHSTNKDIVINTLKEQLYIRTCQVKELKLENLKLKQENKYLREKLNSV